MIVRYESDGSIVMITQNDHAQLSGLFAASVAANSLARDMSLSAATISVIRPIRTVALLHPAPAVLEVIAQVIQRADHA